MDKKLKQAFGNWVDGDRFWGREKDIALFAERIDEGSHMLLIAQRRMGKTSLMREMKRRLSDRYICLFVDFQKSSNAAEAMVELSLAIRPHKPLWTKASDVFSNVLKKLAGTIEKVGVGELGVTLRAGLTSGNWGAKGDQLFDILAESKKPVLLLLDEVPIMVNRMLKGDDYTITPERRKAADEFMSWMRKNSQKHQGKVRMVLSGSIGFEPVLNQANLSATINNFPPFELKPWDIETATGCLMALANEYGIQFQEETPLEMVKHLGCCIPHHVQMFFSYVREWCIRSNRVDFPHSMVEDIYKKEMLSVRGHAELTHYEERLKSVLGMELLPLALDMLTQAAISGCLSREDFVAFRNYYSSVDHSLADRLQTVLRFLEHDGYLEQSPEGYCFISSLLRDWWKTSHGFTFIPIRER